MPVGESSKVRWIRALRSGLRPAFVCLVIWVMLLLLD